MTHRRISLDEITTLGGRGRGYSVVFFKRGQWPLGGDLEDLGRNGRLRLFPRISPSRATPFLTHPVFNSHHSETEMLRYIKRLESRDLSLCNFHDSARLMHDETQRHGGDVSGVLAGICASCIRLRRVSRREATRRFSSSWKNGWRKSPASPAFRCSRTPVRRANTRGCWSIRAYHESRGETHRNICLIPTSAHGTNPASAVMAGLKVVAVACDDAGQHRCGGFEGEGGSASRGSGGADGDLSFHARRLRGNHPRDLRNRP